MLYRSTRSSLSTPPITFAQAVLTGLAPDGGLYIPTTIPQLSHDKLDTLRGLPFARLAASVMRLFIQVEEVGDLELDELCERSFKTFDSDQVVPVKNVGDVKILELFHGPTFAFKDVALQVLGNLFELLKSPTDRITVVGATSGDTGGAAIYGLRGRKGIDVFILHPKGKISRVQEAQMCSVLDSNVHNLAIQGTFDTCQDIVKTLFSDPAFKSTYSLAAVNSINWARILAQTTYYFHAYLNSGATVYSVPSGNFGDVLAGWFARQMGLPIRFIVATNENDILDRFLKTGTYERGNGVKETLSPAMDIAVSSNFERLLWYLHCDLALTPTDSEAQAASDKVVEYMALLKITGKFTVSDSVLELARSFMSSARVDDKDTSDCISRIYHAHGYVLDPHTAIGVVAAERSGLDGVMCLATASPGKFPDAVLGAINTSGPPGFKTLLYEDIAPLALVELEGLPQRVVTINGKSQEGLCQSVVRVIVETLKD